MPASDSPFRPAAFASAGSDYAQPPPRPPERSLHPEPLQPPVQPNFPPPPAPSPPGWAMSPAPPTPSPMPPPAPQSEPPAQSRPGPPPGPSPAAPRTAPPPGTPANLARKLELEAAMLAAPQDPAPRTAYFEHLGRLAVTHTGLQTANLPELGAPLYFRCGTPDIAVLAQIFRDRALAVEMRPTPDRIMVIGAYAGYSAVDLARRFPQAQIMAVEPLADNFRLLQLNAGAWRRIACVQSAVWHHAIRLATTRRFQADWSIRLHDEELATERTVPAVTVMDLIDAAAWPNVDMVVCDAGGSEREVFADPNSPWLIGLDAALVRLHEPVAPRATEWVHKALEPRVFEHRKLGDLELFERRQPRTMYPPTPAELPLLRAEPGLTPFALADVPGAGFGFYVYDGSNCQLHPNPPGGKPARAVFTLRADGHREFVSGVLHAGRPSPPIVFAAAVQREDGSLAGHGEVTLMQRQSGRVAFELASPVSGTVRVLLQTTMAPGAASSAMAWARWLDPRLL